MRTNPNLDAIGAVVAADARGASPQEMKQAVMARQTFDVDLDAPLYRILPAPNLLADIENGRLTHSAIDPDLWDDDNENPLLNRIFDDRELGTDLDVRPLVEHTYGSCWSLAPTAPPEAWRYFSHGQPAVRIQSTGRKLLNAVMDLRNPHYQHQHSLGRVQYVAADALDAYFGDGNWQKHLCPLGHRIALATSALGKDFIHEDEVRLLFSPEVHHQWAVQHVFFDEISDTPFRSGLPLRASPPFDWDGVIDHVVTSPLLDRTETAKLGVDLAAAGIAAPIDSGHSAAVAFKFVAAHP